MKKGIMLSTTAGIILLLISFFVIAAVYTAILPKLKSSADREKCRLSVLAKAKAMELATLGTNTNEGPVSLKCPVQHIEVKKRSIYKEGRKISSTSDENVKKVVANEMYDCWYQFHQGQLDFFSDVTGSLGITGKGNARCMICSEIVFEENSVGVIEQFDNYLRDTTVPSTKYTYEEFLTNGQKSEEPFGTQLDPAEQYSVLFVTQKKDSTARAILDFIVAPLAGCYIGGQYLGGVGTFIVPGAGTAVGGALGCAGGLAAGTWTYFKSGETYSEPFLMSTVLTKTKNIGDSCDRLI